jgi:hypothetical protein
MVQQKVNRAADFLKLLRGEQEGTGLKIIKVNTTEPSPITFVFEGTGLAVDLAIFEIPVDFHPLRKGDRLLVYPILGTTDAGRWAAVQKINGGIVLATMQSSSSLKIAGIDKTYGASDLVIPPFFAVSNANSRYETSDYYLKSGDIAVLQAGDTVSIAPTLDGDKIKYAILERY